MAEVVKLITFQTDLWVIQNKKNNNKKKKVRDVRHEPWERSAGECED